MASGQSTIFEQTTRTGRLYRWVTIWLAVSSIIALLLMANAVRDYRFVSRLLATQQAHHQMTEIAAQLEQQFRRSDGNQGSLQNALGTLSLQHASATLRDTDGAVLGSTGEGSLVSPFTQEQEHGAFSRREPLFKAVSTRAGEMVVEVFAMRPPHKPGVVPAAFTKAADGSSQPPRFYTLEVALPLQQADASVLAPIRRNLAIHSVAALALLATVVLAGVGLRSYVKGRQLEEQVEIARQVQAGLLPEPFAKIPGVDMATVYQPSEVVGGDFYDVFPNEENGFAAVIGDVSGKGLPAALLMGVIHGAVRTAGWQGAEAEHTQETTRLNRLLCERASGNRFASMFWCSYDSQSQSMRYVNAGHCPPFLLSKTNGKLTAKRLADGGPVLGLLPEAPYAASTVTVAPGDLLVMYSDGLVEASGAGDEEYGEERLETLLRGHFHEAPRKIGESLMSAWNSFSPAGNVHDDLTFSVIRF